VPTTWFPVSGAHSAPTVVLDVLTHRRFAPAVGSPQPPRVFAPP